MKRLACWMLVPAAVVLVTVRGVGGQARGPDIVASGVVIVPPSARQLADPVGNPLGFARLQPGQATVRHGLGAAEIMVYLAVVSEDGRVFYQVPAGVLASSAPAVPDGTFTIYNATGNPLAVRWWAMPYPAASEGARPEGSP